MAIRRQKLKRKADLRHDAEGIVDPPPDWAFNIDCPYHGEIAFDFTPFRANGRDNLAGHLRDALWNLRHEHVGSTLKGYPYTLRTFWRFLDYYYAAHGETITRLDEINRNLLDKYLAWLEQQIVPKGTNRGHRFSIGARRQAFKTLKSLLVNRQRRAPDAVSPDLSFPKNPFPNSNVLTPKRDGYSVAEEKRLTVALNADLKCIHKHSGEGLTPLQVFAVHLIILGLATGRNQQPLLELRRDSLRKHPLPDRELLVTFKRRGYSTHSSSVRSSPPPNAETEINAIPATIGDHIRFLADYTAPLAADADARERDYVFLWRKTRCQDRGKIAQLDRVNATKALEAFVKRHALLDDRGRPLKVTLGRLRPTFADNIYRRTGDIRRVQQALGHASVQTTMQRYTNVPFEAERDHAIVLDSMVSRFTRFVIDGRVLLAADGQIPLADVHNLLAEGYATGVARCKNPFRESESLCMRFFHCFRCPGMVVFEDDLWRLFSFYYCLLKERHKINPPNWEKLYGPIIRRIDRDIASQFRPEIVAEARRQAQEHPHPAWQGPLL